MTLAFASSIEGKGELQVPAQAQHLGVGAGTNMGLGRATSWGKLRVGAKGC